jgi:purine-binding chemotaxis protein CheW
MQAVNTEPNRSSSKSGAMQAVVFLWGNQDFAVDISFVSEIIRGQPITRVPRNQAAVEGLIHFRGKVVPVLSLARRLGLVQAGAHVPPWLIILESAAAVAAVAAESIPEILQFDRSTMRYIPTTDRAAENCVAGLVKLGSRSLLLLEIPRMLSLDSGHSEMLVDSAG